jgi:hypothetical protein
LPSATAKNPVDPFIDPDGYRAYIDTGEKEFRSGVVHSQQRGAAVSSVELRDWRGAFMARPHMSVSPDDPIR